MDHSLNHTATDWQQRVRTSLSTMGEASILALYGGCGALVLFATIYLSFIGPQTPGRLERTSYDLVSQFGFWAWLTSLPLPIPHTSQAVAAWLLVAIALAFLGYGAALLLSTQRASSRLMLFAVAGMGLLFSFTNAWALPNLNTDIFNYIMRGRVAAVYGENPYSVAVDEFPDDPLYPYASDRFTAEPGGKLPTWMVLNVLLAKISGHSPVTNVLTYRHALLLINGASLVLVILVMRAIDARRTVTAAVVYSWNPVIIMFGQSKTDTVMAFFVLLAAWVLVARRRWLLSFALLILSAFVKLLTAPLLAIYLMRSIKLRRWKEIAGVGLIAFVLFGLLVLLLYFSAPGAQMLLKYPGLIDKFGPSRSSIVGNLSWVVFMGLVLAAGLLQDGSDRRLLAGWAVVSLFLLTFITPFTLTWYLITAVATISIVGNLHLNLLLLAVSFTSFLFNFWDWTFTSAFPSPEFLDVPRSVFYIAFGVAFGAFIAAVSLLRRVRARRVY